MYDISDLLRELFDRYGNTSELDKRFKQMLGEDAQLNADYKEWCDAQGYRSATGHREFIEEFDDSRDLVWDDYKEYGNDI